MAAKPFIASNVESAAVQSALHNLAGLANDMKPAMEGIGRALLTRVQFGFRKSQSPWGKPWKPITYRKGKPLILTGTLRRSIGYDADEDSVSIGTNIIYAAIHQFGGQAGRHHATTITARPYLPIRGGEVDLPPAWEQDVLNNINRMIEGTLHGAQ